MTHEETAEFNRTMQETIDSWGKSSPESHSNIAAGTALIGSVIAMNAFPALCITGALLYTLSRITTGTKTYTLNRWKTDDGESSS